jgi:hypothetical protein
MSDEMLTNIKTAFEGVRLSNENIDIRFYDVKLKYDNWFFRENEKYESLNFLASLFIELGMEDEDIDNLEISYLFSGCVLNIKLIGRESYAGSSPYAEVEIHDSEIYINDSAIDKLKITKKSIIHMSGCTLVNFERY